MRRAHRLLVLQVVAGAAVVWLSTMGDDAAAKTKKKGKGKGKTAASASASASASAAESASAAASASAPPSAAPAETAALSAAPAESAAPSPAASASETATASADTGSARPTGRDVMLEGIGGVIFGAVPLLGGSAGLLLIPSGATDKTPAYIGLGIGTYAAFIPMTALGVAFAGHLLDVHGTYLGALIGTTIGSAVAAAPTAVLVYEGTRGASVDGIMVMTSLFAFPMVLGTIGGVIGWEVSVSKTPAKTAAMRRWIFPGVTPSPYGATFTLSGAF